MPINVKGLPVAEAAHPWLDGRFVMRSGFYAGRGPMRGDLNEVILEMFYAGILRDVGKKEAKNFVRFVNNLDDLSASAFIVAFERFWSTGCQEVKVEQDPEDGNALSGHGVGLQAEALGLIGATMFGRRRSPGQELAESNSIKAQFIAKHLEEIPKDERRNPIQGTDSCLLP